jgi:murein DD-endopeptidase MepM/ murein hydrolase activator NlpD
VRARVDVGQRLRPGQVLGRVDTGGHCDGRCLHWGAKVGGEYVDPLSFLPRPRPVLKPLALRPPAAPVRPGAKARFPPVRSPAGSASP